MPTLLLLVLFVFQVTWRADIVLWGGFVYLFEIILLWMAIRGRVAAYGALLSVYVMTFVFNPYSWKEMVVLLGISFLAWRASKQWINQTSRTALGWITAVACIIYVGVLSFIELKQIGRPVIGSLILTLPWLFLFVHWPQKSRGLLQ